MRLPIWLFSLAPLVAVGCQSPTPAPLGSAERPVRADAFHGEMEYLGRLRCRDGSRPLTQGLPHRPMHSHRLIRGFRVRCVYLNEEVALYFDPYHPGHVEDRPVAGFRLLEP